MFLFSFPRHQTTAEFPFASGRFPRFTSSFSLALLHTESLVGHEKDTAEVFQPFSRLNLPLRGYTFPPLGDPPPPPFWPYVRTIRSFSSLANSSCSTIISDLLPFLPFSLFFNLPQLPQHHR